MFIFGFYSVSGTLPNPVTRKVVFFHKQFKAESQRESDGEAHSNQIHWFFLSSPQTLEYSQLRAVIRSASGVSPLSSVPGNVCEHHKDALRGQRPRYSFCLFLFGDLQALRAKIII